MRMSRPALGPIQPTNTMGTAPSSGIKGLRSGVDHQPPFSAEVREILQVYLYTPSRPSWPVLG
jgi:hypothetical protein